MKNPAKPRVLIVDDESILANSLSWIFEKRGFETLVAYSPDSAIDISRAFRPDLLLCDLAMPGMGGLTMASIIARSLPHCRVLLLTGDYLSLEHAWSVGRSMFQKHAVLAKPVHPLALLEEAYHLMGLPASGVVQELAVQ